MFILLFIFVKAVEEEEKQEENKQETKRPYYFIYQSLWKSRVENYLYFDLCKNTPRANQFDISRDHARQ